jgi:hypothetical protein
MAMKSKQLYFVLVQFGFYKPSLQQEMRLLTAWEFIKQDIEDKIVQCLDLDNFIPFSLTYDGRLICNRETAAGSSYVQGYNGRAIIHVKTSKGISFIHTTVQKFASVSLKF